MPLLGGLCDDQSVKKITALLSAPKKFSLFVHKYTACLFCPTPNGASPAHPWQPWLSLRVSRAIYRSRTSKGRPPPPTNGNGQLLAPRGSQLHRGGRRQSTLFCSRLSSPSRDACGQSRKTRRARAHQRARVYKEPEVEARTRSHWSGGGRPATKGSGLGWGR